MSYRQAGILGSDGLRSFAHALRGLAVGGGDAVVAVGDSSVRVFAGSGRSVDGWPTGRDGYAVAVAADGGVWVGQAGQIEVFDAAGGRLDAWRDPERLGLVTAIGFSGDGVLAADAVARCIRHYDRRGNFRNNIGDRHRKGGFHIPNGVVDFAVDGDGVIHVANPGMHRVERYTPDGELLGHVGRFGGGDPERFPRRGTDVTFPGCCNPTNVALVGDGRVLVSEKAPPRVKVYDPEGRLLSVVAGAEAFDPAAKNMDLAVDSAGRIFVADTVRRHVCVFEPAAGVPVAGEEGAA